ncbi:hypothetical protein ALT717_10243 [Alteromonas macleodii]
MIREWVLYWRKFMPQIGTRKLYKLIKPKLIEHSIKLSRDGFFTNLGVRGYSLNRKRAISKPRSASIG